MMKESEICETYHWTEKLFKIERSEHGGGPVRSQGTSRAEGVPKPVSRERMSFITTTRDEIHKIPSRIRTGILKMTRRPARVGGRNERLDVIFRFSKTR